MKFGKNQNTGDFYAAEYRPKSGRVEVVDKDKSLDALLTRHDVPADDNESTIAPQQKPDRTKSV